MPWSISDQARLFVHLQRICYLPDDKDTISVCTISTWMRHVSKITITNSIWFSNVNLFAWLRCFPYYRIFLTITLNRRTREPARNCRLFNIVLSVPRVPFCLRSWLVVYSFFISLLLKSAWPLITIIIHYGYHQRLLVSITFYHAIP